MISPKPSRTSPFPTRWRFPWATGKPHRPDAQKVQPEHAQEPLVVGEHVWAVRGKPRPYGRKSVDEDPEGRIWIVVLDDREPG